MANLSPAGDGERDGGGLRDGTMRSGAAQPPDAGARPARTPARYSTVIGSPGALP